MSGMRWLAGLVLAGGVLPVQGCAASPARHEVVSAVVDGDTVDVRSADGSVRRVRVLGIDTPETVKPGYEVACWGREASAWARRELQGQPVTVIADQSQPGRDRYGRTLAYIQKFGGWDYSTETARAGHGKAAVYGRPPLRMEQIMQAQREAQIARRGLWGIPCFGNTESRKK